MTYMIQIDDEVREATAKEAAAIEAQHAANAQIEAAEAAKAAARAFALAKLSALGLTEDEIATLFS